MTKHNQPEEESALFEAFLAAAAGSPNPSFDKAFKEIEPLLRSTATGAAKSWSSIHDPSMEVDDVVQEVLTRCYTSPPNGEGSKAAKRTVLGWVKRVTGNYLTDLYRRGSSRQKDGTYKRRVKPDVDLGQLPSSRGADGRAIRDRAEAREEIEYIRSYMEEMYPKGAKYIEARRDNPDATGNELARLMGVSRANYDQIAKRTRQFVREQRPSASEE